MRGGRDREIGLSEGWEDREIGLSEWWEGQRDRA